MGLFHFGPLFKLIHEFQSSPLHGTYHTYALNEVALFIPIQNAVTLFLLNMVKLYNKSQCQAQ
jgi:hypothetical protein